MCFFGRLDTLDMPTAVQYLKEDENELQALGAAYVQHQCYNENDAKIEVLCTD